MKRKFLFAKLAMLPLVLTCIAVVMATNMFPSVSDPPSWAAAFDTNSTNPRRYHNVIVVAKSGGDFTEVQKALNSISDNSPTNPYLVWVAPGIYTETVTMKPYVDIQGAGELATKITYTGSQVFDGTVRGASNAELRFLTAENTGRKIYAVAISNSDASPSLLHVTAIASGGTFGNFGVYNLNSSTTMANMTVSASGNSQYNAGVENDTSSPVMANMTINALGGALNNGLSNFESQPVIANVTISASGGPVNNGIYNHRSSSTIRNSVVSGSGGQSNYGVYNVAERGSYTVLIDNSTITGSTNTVYQGYFYITRVGAGKLNGGPVVGSNSATCAGVYDEKYAFFPNTCP